MSKTVQYFSLALAAWLMLACAADFSRAAEAAPSNVKSEVRA